MKVFRALGLIILIVALKFLMPGVISGFEETLVVFFDTLQSVAEAGHGLSAGAFVPTVPSVGR